MLCTTPGCTGKHHARGFCEKCYHVWHRRQPAGSLADACRWTRGDDATLRRLRNRGRHSLTEIAQRLGRSLWGVADRARILSLPPMRNGQRSRR